MARKSFLLRLDPKLYQEVAAWAQAEMRSVNGQIEFILREAVTRRRGKPPDENGETGGEADHEARGEKGARDEA